MTDSIIAKKDKKRAEIVAALHELLQKDDVMPVSVSDLAQSLGIAKGGIYYYFDSVDDVFEALIEREYGSVIDETMKSVLAMPGPAIERLHLILVIYQKNVATKGYIDRLLHLPEYADIHQRSLVYITNKLSGYVAEIIRSGIAEGDLVCEFPDEIARMTVGSFAFLLDTSLFEYPTGERNAQIAAILAVFEREIGAPQGSFASRTT